MKISDLMDELARTFELHGDIDVFINTNKNIESAKNLDDSMIFCGEAADCLDALHHGLDNKKIILRLGD